MWVGFKLNSWKIGSWLLKLVTNPLPCKQYISKLFTSVHNSNSCPSLSNSNIYSDSSVVVVTPQINLNFELCNTYYSCDVASITIANEYTLSGTTNVYTR